MVKARKYRVMGTQRRDNQDLLDLAPEKYDICILINVVNGADTGKISQHLISVINLHFSEIEASGT
jgi:hypothetical protein